MPKRRRRGAAGRTLALLLAALVIAGITAAILGLRSLVTELAVSSAQDAVVMAVNAIVKDIMRDEAFDPGRMVTLEKSPAGRVTAISTDVAAANTLASEVLERAVAQTAESVITVGVPLGSLAGGRLLFGKGPTLPVDVVMLSSSVAGFRSELTTAGINQTRHQILLQLHVDISLFMPWRTVGTSVDTEILVSETVIVGEVPESYLDFTKD